MSAEVNQAIVEAFDKGVISSATLMTNMPGFEEACELAHRHRLLGKIGVHLNLSSGYPLSAPIRRCSRLCDDNGYVSEPANSASTVEGGEARRRDGDCGTDRSLPGSWAASDALGFTSSCPYGVGHWSGCHYRRAPVRDQGHSIVAQLWSRDRSSPDKVYKLAYNTRLRIYGLAKTRYFGSSADVQEILATAPGDVEVMVHLPVEGSRSSSQALGIERWLAPHQLASYQ